MSTTQLIRLKKEHVTDEVIQAMVEASAASQQTTGSRQPSGSVAIQQEQSRSVSQSADDPAGPHPAGIYYLDKSNGKLVQIYPSVTDSSLSNTGGMYNSAPAISPNEFVLVKTEVKKGSRELTVGQVNAFGAQSGTLDKYVQPFDYDEISKGTFKVTPRTDLGPGEGCFFYGGTSAIPTFGVYNVNSGGKVFDFGIH